MATESSQDAATVEQTSVHRLDTRSHEPSNRHTVASVLLVWLDNHIDHNDTDCLNTITQLQRIVNKVHTFTDDRQCIEFIQSMTNERACMIISGSLGQRIVPCVHSMSQVDSIFIFCSNKRSHEQWIRDWSKVKGVFTAITPICEALKETAQECEGNDTSFSFMATTANFSKQNLDQLKPSFMYTQILKEILLSMTFEQKHFTEFIEYCRCCVDLSEDANPVKIVDKFQRKYHKKTPIYWYTYNCFLFRMVNRALLKMNVDTIIKSGFFIGDLHRHIEKLHKKQFDRHRRDKTFTVYRGQIMSKKDFEEMTQTQGGLISFHSFLSTSKKQKTALGFANQQGCNLDQVRILFVMNIDPTKSTTPFASIDKISCYNTEDEVLFSMHTVFRICDIRVLNEGARLHQVELTLTNDSDNDMRALMDCIREETYPTEKGWYRLGLVLLKMGQPKKAETVFEIQLQQTTKKAEEVHIYSALGRSKYEQGEYREAIIFHEKSLEVTEKSLRSNHPALAESYNDIGLVYDSMKDYSKALSFYEKALYIQQQSPSSDGLALAQTYNNIGNAYNNMGEFSKALSCYEKDLEISQKALPPTHPDLATSYSNIGAVYRNIGEYSIALSNHEKAREIRRRSLPPDHPDLGSSHNNIGNVHFSMGNYLEARSSYEDAVVISTQSLLSNHPERLKWEKNLDIVRKKLSDDSFF